MRGEKWENTSSAPFFCADLWDLCDIFFLRIIRIIQIFCLNPHIIRKIRIIRRHKLWNDYITTFHELMGRRELHWSRYELEDVAETRDFENVADVVVDTLEIEMSVLILCILKNAKEDTQTGWWDVFQVSTVDDDVFTPTMATVVELKPDNASLALSTPVTNSTPMTPRNTRSERNLVNSRIPNVTSTVAMVIQA